MGLKVWCDMGLSNGEVYCCWGVGSMMLRRSCSSQGLYGRANKGEGQSAPQPAECGAV